jgi:hypothetical protein
MVFFGDMGGLRVGRVTGEPFSSVRRTGTGLVLGKDDAFFQLRQNVMHGTRARLTSTLPAGIELT